MSVPVLGLSSRWFASPLILAVAALLTLFAATGFLGLRYWHERQAATLAFEHGRQVLDTLDRLRSIIADLEAERRGYLLTLLTVVLVLRTPWNPLWLIAAGALAGMAGLA